MAKILGIDLGTNSLGWAIVEKNEEESCLKNKGVNIFQECVDKDSYGREIPKVQERTKARSTRRKYSRRRARKIDILQVLIANDFCPHLTNEQLNSWKTKKQYPLDKDFLQWLATDDKYEKNPFKDRYIALTQKLDLQKQSERYILGRAFYHLGQKRGFRSNRKTNKSEEAKGVVKESINNLCETIKDSGYQYLGEFYYHLYSEKKNIRNNGFGEGFGYTDRNAHYINEFNAICKQQDLDEELKNALYRAIFFQRPLKSQKWAVGNCTFEKKKARCPISHPRFEEFRMYQFINNIKIKTPYDDSLRDLTDSERQAIIPIFLGSKDYFKFEEIAKKLSPKNQYSYYKDISPKDYQFNYKMDLSFSSSITTRRLISVFGKDWITEICSTYLKSNNKNTEQIINDIWHAIFSFDDKEKLFNWAINNLQLNEEEANKFKEISIIDGYASMSLNVINKALPYLRAGYKYDKSIILANLRKVVGDNIWNDDTKRNNIITDINNEYNFATRIRGSKKEQIECILLDEYGIEKKYIDKLYHPTIVEGFRDATKNKEGILQLNFPNTKSLRNPVVMRSLFHLRSLINTLLNSKEIDENTTVNIEMAREHNSANQRAAIKNYQDKKQKNRIAYVEKIQTRYFEETGKHIIPNETDILKYQLWNEQKHLCLYTNAEIRISDFIGSYNRFDIEHTIPRSRKGDDSLSNKTLCDSRFNRDIKKAHLPSELNNYEDILVRIKGIGWFEKITSLEKQIEKEYIKARTATTKENKDIAIQRRNELKLELKYWKDKVANFTVKEITADFTRRQGVDIGIIGKYTKKYLETVFKRVFTVKGSTTADFRKMWGLQELYSKKERSNHTHHCIDAITIACIDKEAYSVWHEHTIAKENELFEAKPMPKVQKPWETFTEDVKSIAEDTLISHSHTDNMPKRSHKKLRIRGKVQYDNAGNVIYQKGDTARQSLHKDTFYGLITHKEEKVYVVRKSITELSADDINNIIDDKVQKCIEEAIKKEGIKAALSHPICFNKEKGVYIKKVRVKAGKVSNPIKLKKHQNLSKHQYKHFYYVCNEGNYCIAIYEGSHNSGKTKRSFIVINNLEAAKAFNKGVVNNSVAPLSDQNDLPLKYILKIGTLVLLYENDKNEIYSSDSKALVKRLYIVKGIDKDSGRITLVHHQDARPSSEIQIECGKGIPSYTADAPAAKLRLTYSKLNALVEGYDFEQKITGEIIFKNNN